MRLLAFNRYQFYLTVCCVGEVFDGIVLNDLCKSYTHLLTGYVGNANFLLKIEDIVRKLRAENPKIVFREINLDWF